MTTRRVRVMYMSVEIKVVKPKDNAPLRKKRVAAYARVSVDKDASEHSLENQMEVYREYISSRPEWEFQGVYSDDAFTGTNTSRPGFQEMLKDSYSGKVDIILTKSISRFARNTVDLLNTVRDLRARGISIRFERENIDTLTTEGDFLLTLLASFAEAEARSVSENTLWSIRKRFEEGIGNNYFLYGYKWDGKKFNIIEEEAEVVRFIFSSYLEGNGPKIIARILTEKGILNRSGNPFSYTTISQMLRCEKYKGDSLFQKTYTTDYITKKKRRNKGEVMQYYAVGTHPIVIDSDTFDKVQSEIEKRAELGYLSNRTMHFSCFTSRLLCSKCGRAYRKRENGLSGYHKTRIYKWVCSTKIEGTAKACSATNVPDRLLVALTAEVLGRDDYDKDFFDSHIDHIEVEGNTLIYIMKEGTTVEKHWTSPAQDRKLKEKKNGSISNTDSSN